MKNPDARPRRAEGAVQEGGTRMTRRALLVGLPLALAGCTATGMPAPVRTTLPTLGHTSPHPPAASPHPPVDPRWVSMYAGMQDGGYWIPAIDVSKIDPRYFRQEVSDPTGERPGTLVVDTSGPFLYLVRENGRALRYGIGVGRDGFEWAGRAKIQMKREWPTWTPPASMIARQPELEPYRNGMEPGLDNPLGARALYLFEGGRDTLYRIHGTNEPWSIGKAVSSGCIRMFNQDVIDLYGRVPTGTVVLVRQHGPVTSRAVV
jgi:lipoprotein-anchoring transpeptidase ErfK/SrfK